MDCDIKQHIELDKITQELVIHKKLVVLLESYCVCISDKSDITNNNNLTLTFQPPSDNSFRDIGRKDNVVTNKIKIVGSKQKLDMAIYDHHQ